MALAEGASSLQTLFKKIEKSGRTEVNNIYNKMHTIIQNLTPETLDLMITRTKEISKALNIDLSLEQYLKLIIVMNQRTYFQDEDILNK